MSSINTAGLTATMRGEMETLRLMGEARQRNFSVYKEMATLTDAHAVGFVPRAGSDVTLRLIAAALRDAPERTRELLCQIAENDEEVVRLTKELSR